MGGTIPEDDWTDLINIEGEEEDEQPLVEFKEFGGPEGAAERWRNDSTRRSRHQREITADRLRQHRRRLVLFGILALFGFLVLTWAVTADTNPFWRVPLGIILVVPFITEARYA